MMKARLALTLLGFFSLLSVATPDDVITPPDATDPPRPPPPSLCQLGDIMFLDERDFPNFGLLDSISYEMAVEFSLPNVNQTDFYVEYYDSAMRKGRVECHQAGRKLEYIYRMDTMEAWNIEGTSCKLNYVNETPEFFRDDQTNWRYDIPDKPEVTTIGPSAMFKIGYDAWQNRTQNGIRTMAFMGEQPHSHVRGKRALMWRMCQTEKAFVDFYFAADDEGSFFAIPQMPLRVHYNSERDGEKNSPVTDQYYDILNFQPYVSFGIYPFELPRGIGCKRRRDLEDLPKMPDFSNKNLFFYSEVVYSRVNMKNGEDLGSYYSKLMFAVDIKDKLFGYRHSPWNTTKVKKEGGEEVETTFVDGPEYTVYDMEYGYYFKVDYNSAQCQIGKDKHYVPAYVLPENNGYLDLTNPYLLFPNSEFYYLTKSHGRGMEVDVFETNIDGYLMNEDTQVKKAVSIHTYLRGDEKTDNVVSVTRTPTQVELQLYREGSEVKETLTFNFFGFTTKVASARQRFSVSRCFKNNEDYSYISLNFDTVNGSMDALQNVDQVDVEFQVMELINRLGNLKPYRIPNLMIEVKDELQVTFILLEKPNFQLDFPDTEADTKIDGVEAKELSTLVGCATSCLEKGGCWGFSLCGGLCYVGGSTTNKTVTAKGCTLYKRDSEKPAMIPKDSFIRNLQEEVERGDAKMEVNVGDNTINLKATSIFVSSPAEADPTFEKMGNTYSDRMRVFKVAKKLKKGISLGKTRFEECQRLCLTHPSCETISYCLMGADCIISSNYGDDIKDDEIEDNQLCQLVTKKYADNFEVNPGFFMDISAKKTIKVKDNEACARACLKEPNFECLSFDYCGGEDNACRLHTSHFLKKDTRKESLDKRARCRHYTRKYSIEFKKHIDTQVVGANLQTMADFDVEECAKRCVEFGRGSCFGFDYCKAKGATSGSCIIIDSDPALMKTKYSAVCTHYLRADVDNAPARPYSTNYAGGIGFLCLLVGGLLGALVVFGIAYLRINRR